MFHIPNMPVLTTPEPRFIQTMVRDGFPVQAQLKTASEPRSTRRDCGSVAIRGPTAERRPALLPVTGCGNQNHQTKEVTVSEEAVVGLDGPFVGHGYVGTPNKEPETLLQPQNNPRDHQHE